MLLLPEVEDSCWKEGGEKSIWEEFEKVCRGGRGNGNNAERDVRGVGWKGEVVEKMSWCENGDKINDVAVGIARMKCQKMV